MSKTTKKAVKPSAKIPVGTNASPSPGVPAAPRADVLLDQFIEAILIRGGYVDPDVVYVELVKAVPNIKYSDRYRQLSWIHVNSTSAIDVYCRNNDIRAYHELEAFVVAALSKVLKGRSIATFLDVGVGFFHMHPRVVELYGWLENPVQLRILSRRDVIDAAMSFKSKGSKKWYDLDKSGKEKWNHEFLKYLATRYEGPLAVSVDYCRLCPKLNRGADEKNVIKTVGKRIADNSLQEMMHHVTKLTRQCTVNGNYGYVKKVLRNEGIDVNGVFQKVCAPLLNVSLDKNDADTPDEMASCGDFFRAQLTEFMRHTLPLSAVYNSATTALNNDGATESILNQILDKDFECSMLKQRFFVYQRDQKSIDCQMFASVIVGLAIFISIHSDESLAGYVFKDALYAELVNDFPPVLLNQTFQFLRDNCFKSGFVTTFVDPLSRDRKFTISAESHFSNVVSKIGVKKTAPINAIVEGELQGNGKKMRDKREAKWAEQKKLYGIDAVDYLGLAGGVILFSRIAKLERKMSTPVIEIKDVNEMAAVSIASIASNDLPEADSMSALAATLSKRTLSLLSRAHDDVLNQLSAPAFECVAPGNVSFLRFLEGCRHGTMLKEFFQRIFDANHHLLSQSHGNDDYEANTFDDSLTRMDSNALDVISETLAAVLSDNSVVDMDFGFLKVLYDLEMQVQESITGNASFSQVFNKSFLQLLCEELFMEADEGNSMSIQLKEQFCALHQMFGSAAGEAKRSSAESVSVTYPLVRDDLIFLSKTRHISLSVFRVLLNNYFASRSPPPLCSDASDWKTELKMHLPELFQSLALLDGDDETELSADFLNSLSQEMGRRGNLLEYKGTPMKHTVLSFHGDQRDVISDDVEMDYSNRAVMDELVQLIIATPLGSSCRLFSMWDDLFPETVNKSEVENSPSILSIIVAEADQLQQLRPLVRYVCFSARHDDCIPLPTEAPSSVEVAACISNGNYSKVGIWCLAASSGCIDEEMFTSRVLNICFMESSGRSGLYRLLDLTLEIALSVPPSVRQHVFILCMDSISFAKEIPPEAVEKHLIEYLLSDNADSTLRSRADTVRYLKLIVGISSQCTRASLIRSFLPQILQCLKKHLQLSSDVSNPKEGMGNGFVEEDQSSASEALAPRAEATVDQTITSQAVACRQRDDIYDCKGFISQLLETDFSSTKDSPTAQKLQSALERIAGDLYSSDVHFVMELVQNADDNSYDVSLIPTLKIDLYGHAMVIHNNEIGFSSQNIKAVCNVGGSTKAGLSGYIGQKGIGFKSVFSVSDSPEIHSNGFHIRFDRKNMIEPIWIDENASTSWPQHNVNGEHFGTIIRLNLDQRARLNYAQLNENLECAFEGKLLLFLNKLKKMKLEDKCINRSLEHSKKILSESWTEMLASYVNYPLKSVPEELSYWFIRKRSFDPEVKRKNDVVDRTEVAVAFQFVVCGIEEVADGAIALQDIDDIEHEADDNIPIEKYEPTFIYELKPVVNSLFPVYAFLPTKECIFRFIVQGDYLLSSSREAIQEGGLQDGYAWNKKLLEVSAELLVEVIVELFNKVWNITFKENLDCAHLDEIGTETRRLKISSRDVLSCLPMPSMRDQTSLFKYFSNSVYSQLRISPIFRSRDGIPLVPAEEAISTHNVGFNPRDYMSEDLLFASTGRRFLHDDLILDDELAELLGVPTFTVATVLQCAKTIASDAATSGSLDIQAFAGILVMLALFSDLPLAATSSTPRPKTIIPSQVFRKSTNAKSFSSKPGIVGSVNKRHIETLKALCIWPMGNEKITSLSEIVLFVNAKSSFASAQKSCFETFKYLIPLLDDRVLKEASNMLSSGRDVVQKFLLQYMKIPPVASSSNGLSGGIGELSAELIIKRFILPHYSQNSVPDRETAAAFIGFLYSSSKLSRNVSNSIDGYFAENEAIIPVARINNQNRWVPGRNSCRVQKQMVSPISEGGSEDGEEKQERAEVHLGLEIMKSAVTTFCKLPVYTALRQMEFTIVDPICAFYAFGKRPNTEVGFYDNRPIENVFSSPPDEESWKAFLLKLGVVNLFDAKYALSRSSIELSDDSDVSIVSFIRHISRNGKPICTSSVRAETVEYAVVSNDSADEIVQVDHLPSAKTHIPLYLPFPNDGTILVTEDVYNIMSALISLIVQEIDICTSAISPAFLQWLNESAWFPAYVHQALWSDETPYYVLSSPRNIFMEKKWPRACPVCLEELLGPQSLYVCAEYAPIILNSLRLTEAFGFMMCERNTYWVEMSDTFVTMFEWMVHSQTDNQCYTSEYIITQMYDQLFSILRNPVDMKNVAFLKRLWNLTAQIWLPDEPKSSPDDEIVSKAIQRGQFHPVEYFVKIDSSTHFLSLADGPVKVLSRYYSSQGRDLMEKLFTRKHYCSLCSAVEGMFGVRGGPLGEKARKYSDATDAIRCTCKDQGFGQFHHIGGLIKSSPSMHDMLALLRYLKKEVLKQSSCRASDNLHIVKNVLVELSVSTWKSFNTIKGLRPYSAGSLKLLKDTLATEALFPTMDRKFARTSYDENSTFVIAVTDKHLWQLFGRELVALETDESRVDPKGTGNSTRESENALEFVWLYAISDDRSADIYHDESLTQYNLAEIEDDVADLVKLPRREFLERTENIPQNIFYAPRNYECILRYLGIPTLSSYTKDEWILKKVDPEQSNSKPTSFVPLMNRLLYVAQTFLSNKKMVGLGRLEGMPRFQDLLALKVQECCELSRRIELRIHDTVLERESNAPYHYDTEKLTMFVHLDIEVEELRDLCVGLVMRALRTEVAKINNKNDFDLMKDLEDCLRKMAPIDSSGVAGALQVQGLNPFPQDVVPWKLCTEVFLGSILDSSEPVQAEGIDFGSPVDDVKTESALAGYVAFKERVKARSAECAHKPSVPSTFANPELEQFKKDKAEEIAAVSDIVSNSTATVSPTRVPNALSSVEVPIDKSYQHSSRIFNSDVVGKESARHATGDVGIGGRRIWDGTFNPNFLPRCGSSSVVNMPVSLSDESWNVDNWIHEELSEDLRLRLISSASGLDDTLNGASSNDNSAGRVGERLGCEYFRKLSSIDDVNWVNKEAEKGHPYDIILSLTNGQTKYCEVKTRYVAYPGWANKWFISPKEIKFAYEKDADYFLLCICLAFDRDNGRIYPPQASVVGFEHGFVEAAHTDEVSVLVQLKGLTSESSNVAIAPACDDIIQN